MIRVSIASKNANLILRERQENVKSNCQRINLDVVQIVVQIKKVSKRKCSETLVAVGGPTWT